MTKETMSDAELHVMARLAEALREDKPDDVVVFTRDEAEVLKEWAKFMIAWKTLGRWAPGAKQVILFFGGGLAFLAAIRPDLFGWLRELTGGGK